MITFCQLSLSQTVYPVFRSPLAPTSEPPSPFPETASDVTLNPDPDRFGPDWGDLASDKFQIRVDSPLINQNQFATPSVFPPLSMPTIDEVRIERLMGVKRMTVMYCTEVLNTRLVGLRCR